MSKSPAFGGKALASNPTNRIDQVLATRAPGLWPFLVAGYPSAKFTIELLRRMKNLPIRGVEIGFPFSDPIADGPVIQEAFTRSLASGLRVSDVFDIVKSARADVDYPVLGMVSASIVHRVGADDFVAQAKCAGLDGLIVPDISLEEAPRLAQLTTAAELRLSMLIAPTTPPDRQARIAQIAGGFLYYVSIQGTTGARKSLPDDLKSHVTTARATTGLPVRVGVGSSSRDRVREVCQFGNGAIGGRSIVSTITRLIDRESKSEAAIIESCTQFISDLAG